MSEPSIGHNTDAQTTRLAKEQLKSLIERIERLEEEKKSTAEAIRDVYAEAKSGSFDVKTIRAIIRMRAKDADTLEEEQTILETYMLALGMI